MKTQHKLMDILKIPHATSCSVRGNMIWLLVGQEISVFYKTASRPAMRSTQFPIQWAPGLLSPDIKELGC